MGRRSHSYFLYGAHISTESDVARDIAKKYFPKEWEELAYTSRILDSAVEANDFWSDIGSTGAWIKGTDYELRMIGSNVFIYCYCAYAGIEVAKIELPSEETIQKFKEWIQKENIPHLGIGYHLISDEH